MEIKRLSAAQIALLKKPLPPEAIKPNPAKTFLSSIKVIYMVERLNEVFGLGGWYVNNDVVESRSRMIVVKSTFHAPDYGILVPDIFGGNDNADRGDAYKGACTDALSKIASYLYIGMDVYKGNAVKEHEQEASGRGGASKNIAAKKTGGAKNEPDAKPRVSSAAQTGEAREVAYWTKELNKIFASQEVAGTGLKEKGLEFLAKPRTAKELREKHAEVKRWIKDKRQKAARAA